MDCVFTCDEQDRLDKIYLFCRALACALANLMRPFTDLALPGTPPSAREAEQAAQSLRLRGFQAPSWASLLDGTDGANPAGEEDSSLKSRRGWQRSASAAVDKRAFEMLFADLDTASRAPSCPRVAQAQVVCSPFCPPDRTSSCRAKSSESCCCAGCDSLSR